MQIREFAQQLLYGESLADKLIVPGEAELEDTRPGPVLQNIPRQPGRPAALRFEHDRNRRHAYNLRDLENENNRGALLHHFANHEVLAIELMALALLRFPDAPSAFVRALCAVLPKNNVTSRCIGRVCNRWVSILATCP